MVDMLICEFPIYLGAFPIFMLVYENKTNASELKCFNLM